MCDLESIGVSSLFKLIRRVTDLGMMCPTLDKDRGLDDYYSH